MAAASSRRKRIGARREALREGTIGREETRLGGGGGADGRSPPLGPVADRPAAARSGSGGAAATRLGGGGGGRRGEGRSTGAARQGRGEGGAQAGRAGQGQAGATLINRKKKWRIIWVRGARGEFASTNVRDRVVVSTTSAPPRLRAAFLPFPKGRLKVGEGGGGW